MTQIDGLIISPELVSLLKRWQESDMSETYIPALLDIQDFLSRQLGESLGNPAELSALSNHINTLVGIRDELKELKPILNPE